jgi:hypothetical protein
MRVKQRSSWCGLLMSCERRDLARVGKFASGCCVYPRTPACARPITWIERIKWIVPTECQAFIRPAAGSAESLCFYGCLHFSNPRDLPCIGRSCQGGCRSAASRQGAHNSTQSAPPGATARNPRRLLNARAADRHCAWASQEGAIF